MFYGLLRDTEGEARKRQHKQTSRKKGPGEDKAGRGAQPARGKPVLLSKATCVSSVTPLACKLN